MKRENQRDATSRGFRRIRAIEQLESREMLHGSGLSWTDTSQLTLSFAPDGTDIAGEPSELHKTFDTVARRAEWTEAVLHAFQVWAQPTTANIGVVNEKYMATPIAEPLPIDAQPVDPVAVDNADGEVMALRKGFPFGSPGPRTQDPRFGDIRIGARPLSENVKAIAISNDTLISGTWSGDIVFNSNADFDGVDEIFALALHEAGHVFGLDHNGNENSPMFEHGTPKVIRPTGEDRAEMRERHGIRVRDQYDLGVGNDTIDLATVIEIPATNSFIGGSIPAVLFGSMHAGTDVDYYRFPRLANYSGDVKIQLKTRGISLLSPKISIVTANGDEIVSRSSTNPRGGNLSVGLERIQDEANELFIRVESAREPRSPFSVGDYSLAVTFSGRNVISDADVNAVLDIRNRDLLQAAVSTFFDESTPVKVEPEDVPEEPETADFVSVRRGFAPFTYYEAIDTIANAAETDYFRFNTIGLGRGAHAHISIRPLRNGTLVPATVILDENRTPVPAEILVNGNGELVVQAQLVPGKQYAIGVRADDGLARFQKGDYRLLLYFTDDAVHMEEFASGVVNDDALPRDANRVKSVRQSGHKLHVGQSHLFHFSLAASAEADLVPTLTNGVAAHFRDEKGNIVYRLSTPMGKTRTSHSVFLTPGTYTVQVFPLSLTESKVGLAKYSVSGTQISDPFAIDPDDVTEDPFDCPGEDGVFCYPGGIQSEDPFIWDDFIDSLPEVPSLQIEELIATLLGDWWQWYWNQSGENGPTLAYDDTFTTAPNVPLAVNAANGVLANDVDPEGDEFAATLHEGTTKGELALEFSGAFTYLPELDFVGLDQFVYVAYDFNQDPVNRLPAEFGVVSIEVIGQSGVDGDLNGDGAVDIVDVNLVSSAILAEQGYLFDINSDGELDVEDLNYLVTVLIGTVRGDANLDGEFGSDDLIDIFGAAQYEDGIVMNSTWVTGDWNADGEFDSGDLVAAFQDGGYIG